MSRYSTETPTSHRPAHPPYEWYATSPVQAPGHSQAQSPYRYEPPPPVPSSLYRTSHHGGSYGYHGSSDTYAGPSRPNKGRDYLKSIESSMAALDLSSQRTFTPPAPPAPAHRMSMSSDKPLPRLPPPPPLPTRTFTEITDTYPSFRSPSADRTRPVSQLPIQTRPSPSTPLKTFKPSVYLHLPVPPRTPPNRDRPHSAPDPGSTSCKGGSRKKHEVVDLTLDSPTTPPGRPSPRLEDDVTPRTYARLKRRGASDQPQSGSGEITRPPGNPIPSPSPAKESSSATRCAGYTRAGERCKRTVKVEAPYLNNVDINTSISTGSAKGTTGAAGNEGKRLVGDEDEREEEGETVGGRYCKDHAGMICGVEGFYSRDKPGLWIRFDDWVPREVGQQTKALLRTTMESRLTAKESPGFIYAYELRDLQTASTSFFKVGRTDNVPRRIGEWTNQCQSKTPTLRDIFPLSASRLSASSSHLPSQRTPTRSGTGPRRTGTLNRSFLPGAISSGTPTTTPPNPSVKRWEKLVHLELADIAASARPDEWESVRGRCGDCGKVHREVFAIPREQHGGGDGGGGGGEGCYQVVLEVVCRWERFTRMSAPGNSGT